MDTNTETEIKTLSEMFGTQMQTHEVREILRAFALRFPTEVQITIEGKGLGYARWSDGRTKFNVRGEDTSSGPRWYGWITSAQPLAPDWQSREHLVLDKLLADMVRAYRPFKEPK